MSIDIQCQERRTADDARGYHSAYFGIERISLLRNQEKYDNIIAAVASAETDASSCYQRGKGNGPMQKTFVQTSSKQRAFGPDVVRVLALILLLWLHFFLRNGFYYRPVNTTAMTIAAAGRCVFMCCIPLFLMLTGYLKCGKEWKKGYYAGLFPMLLSWAIVSVICLWYNVCVAGQQKTAWEWLCLFFDFKLANYSWYLEMYIGLLLVSPFLNMAWNHLQTRRQHTAMVLVFAFLTFLPNTFNGITLDGEHVLNLLPNYWTSLYFFTYYLIGCWIRTYRPKLNSVICVISAVTVALCFGVINRYTGGAEGDFYDGFNISYSHLGTVVISVFLFLGTYRLECSCAWIRKTMAVLSGVTLEMYLISCVFDQPLYVLEYGKYGAEQYLSRGLVLTGLVFVGSFFSGWLIHQISAGVDRWIRSIWESGV